MRTNLSGIVFEAKWRIGVFSCLYVMLLWGFSSLLIAAGEGVVFGYCLSFTPILVDSSYDFLGLFIWPLIFLLVGSTRRVTQCVGIGLACLQYASVILWCNRSEGIGLRGGYVLVGLLVLTYLFGQCVLWMRFLTTAKSPRAAKDIGS